ncbi:hypothetical protein FOVSG1_008908 [Fusarium oxysporum f. sp. vasinfectum]
MTEVSATRLYLGNLPRNATKSDVEAHFATHGTGEITEVKLMNGFGFIEYKDPMDARDVVPAFHGSDFMGERLTVQFARGSRHREGGFGNHERTAPRPRRTPHRMQITGLPNDTSWQDLKDFARQSSLDVVYSETGRDSNGRGFVEFETAADLRTAVEKLDGREFKGQRVQCVADTQPDMPPRERGRSRSPGRRPYPPPMDDYDRRGPPRGYILVAITMMIAPVIDLLLAVPWRTILPLPLAAATMTPIAATTLLRPIPMPMGDLLMTDLLEISLRERADTHEMVVIPETMIVVDATDLLSTECAKWRETLTTSHEVGRARLKRSTSRYAQQ